MANDLSAIMPKILARGLMVLRERCTMPRVVNSDYSTEAAQKGQTIDVPVPTAVGVQDVTPSNTPPSPSDTTPDLVQIELDQWKQNDPIHLTDKEMVEIDKNRHFLPMQMGEAIKALCSTVNQFIFSKYKNVFGATGAAGTTPFGTSAGVVAATNARKVLNQQLCPKTSRRGVLDFDAEANALALSPFSDAEKIMSAEVKLEGEIGRKYGIDWMADDEVPTHTAGTIQDASAGRTCAVDNVGGYAAGIDTINVDNGAEASVTGTILPGDIISFAGHAQTYAINPNSSSPEWTGTGWTGAYTFATNAITLLKFYPPLKEAVADDEVITVVDTHVVNLAFHRDAFAFATRPLVASTADLELGSRILSMQDPQTGLVLRLEVSRQHKQVVWEFDLLYGAELVRPELACRILG